MSILDDIMADDAAIFLDPDLTPGAEQIEYQFATRPGVWVAINAQVFRDPPYVGTTDGSRPAMMIIISAADVPSPNLGKDRVRLKYKPGMIRAVYPVTKFEQVDGAMWQLTLNSVG